MSGKFSTYFKPIGAITQPIIFIYTPKWLYYLTTWQVNEIMQNVIYSRFNDLRRKKALAEDRDISIRAVARETGIAHTTLLRIASNGEDVQGVRLSTINALCQYFQVGSVSELIEYKND